MEAQLISITTIGFKLFDDLQREADKSRFDLKTPLGQFSYLETLVGTNNAADLFNVGILITGRSIEILTLDFGIQFNKVIMKQWQDGLDLMVSIWYNGTIRDWYRLLRKNNETIRSALAPLKIIGHIERCNKCY